MSAHLEMSSLVNSNLTKDLKITICTSCPTKTTRTHRLADRLNSGLFTQKISSNLKYKMDTSTIQTE